MPDTATTQTTTQDDANAVRTAHIAVRTAMAAIRETLGVAAAEATLAGIDDELRSAADRLVAAAKILATENAIDRDFARWTQTLRKGAR